MKTVKCIVNTSFVIAVMLVSLFATVSDIQVQAKAKKVLVVYFTSTGTTEKVAKKIQKETKGTIIRIRAKEPYKKDDLDWTRNNSQVTKERNTDKDALISPRLRCPQSRINSGSEDIILRSFINGQNTRSSSY